VKIKLWPPALRPRERMRTSGASVLSDAELLALYLCCGTRRQNAIEVAGALLQRFGSLRGVMDAAAAELDEIDGIGPAKVAKLQAASELARRALLERLRQLPVLDDPRAVCDYLKWMIGARPHEVFACLYLDARNRLIASEEASRGTLTHAAVYPREIVKRALTLNAAALIVAHNHPSGQLQPSASDVQITLKLRDALRLIDVRLLDHFVVCPNQVLSFAQRGLL
jgi:DNA repair protein RadC